MRAAYIFVFQITSRENHSFSDGNRLYLDNFDRENQKVIWQKKDWDEQILVF